MLEMMYQEERRRAMTVGSSASGCGKILLVEDEDSLATVLGYNLLKYGFNVIVAHDGLEACQIIDRERPQLILLDIMVPGIDGLDICRKVRQHQDGGISQIPIVMLSALNSKDDILRGEAAGANLYLPKPYNIKQVIANCHNLLLEG